MGPALVQAGTQLVQTSPNVSLCSRAQTLARADYCALARTLQTNATACKIFHALPKLCQTRVISLA